MKNILVRADSSSKIGIGHIMRDLVLVEEFKNSNIIFACQNLKGNINKKILDSGLKVEVLKSNNFEELDVLIKSLKIDLLIIDHYGINYDFEKKLKNQNAKLKILAFDDTYENHYCDILLNHNIYAQETEYKDLVPEDCEIRCGSKYTLIRREFEKLRKVKKSKKKKSFFIAMGGSDAQEQNIRVLKLLKRLVTIEINIVTTSANKNLKKLINFCKRNNIVNLYIDSINIASIMNRSDFAIVTPSVTVHEIIYMKIPFIVIETADNQKYMSLYLKQRNILVLNKNKYNSISKLIKNKKKFSFPRKLKIG